MTNFSIREQGLSELPGDFHMGIRSDGETGDASGRKLAFCFRLSVTALIGSLHERGLLQRPNHATETDSCISHAEALRPDHKTTLDEHLGAFSGGEILVDQHIRMARSAATEACVLLCHYLHDTCSIDFFDPPRKSRRRFCGR